MDVLVIGGSRFSGRKLVELLAKREHSVMVINRGKSEKAAPPFIQPEKYQYPEGVEVLHADRKNTREFARILRKSTFEAIIDTCAYTEPDVRTILQNTPKGLEHYVMVSTASVYDEKKLRMFPIAEEAPIGSMGDDEQLLYSRDKRKAEAALKTAYQETGFPMTIIRPTYIYGPNNPLYREYYFFDRLLDKRPIFLPGSGDFIIDFVFVSDVAWLLAAPLESKKAKGQVYNATGEGGLTLNSYIDILAEIVGVKQPEVIHYNPEILQQKELQPKTMMQMFPFSYSEHLLLSREKAVKDFGYRPTPFYTGVRITFQWYEKRRNRDWQPDYSLDEKIRKYLDKKYTTMTNYKRNLDFSAKQ
ncbi:MAG: NAD-dependent epimerase/dehydratase family protein [Candidatus Heimdallarchaeota archaeon]